MKKLLTLLAGLATSTALWAVPAKSVPFTVLQPDGTTITVQQVGDEWFHYFVNVETGERLLTDDNIVFRPMTEAEYSARRSFSNARRATSYGTEGTSLDLKGKRKSLVLLVSFSDLDYTASQSFMNNQMNQKGFSENGHIGSVRDYFLDQSYGQFEVDFDVVGPYKMPQKMAYYGKNNSTGQDSYVGEMVAAACQQAYEEGVDFSQYDWNGDGEAEMVTVIYAGYGEAQSNNTQNIWPHQWYLSATHDYNFNDGPGALNFNGTKVDKYLVLNELNGSYGKQIDGIGTFCHEFSHSLDLPDIYDVNYINFGMNAWSVMDRGCYNANGSIPMGYTAYERMFCGWLEPTVLSEGATIKDMPAIVDEPVAYKIVNDAVPTEYYLLYNVQQKSWDYEAPGHGMLIIHVDYDANIWYNNQVNVTGSRQRCTIFHADNNSYETASGLAGDPFPGTMNVVEFSDNSVPASTLYNYNTDNKRLMHKPITAITENYPRKGEGKISFKFMGGEKVFVEAPVAGEAIDVTPNGFTAVWNPIADPNATYNLLLTTMTESDAFTPEEVKLLSEDFSGFQSGSYTDKGKELDNYMSNQGWEGLMVYIENGRIKIGSTGTVGNLISPEMKIVSGNLTFAYHGKPYVDGSAVKLNVSLLDQAGYTVSSTMVDGKDVIVLTGIPDGTYRVKITPEASMAKNARIYLYGVAFYDGIFTNEEIFGNATSSPHRIQRYVRQTIKDLKQTSYVVTNLPADCSCTYEVQAVDAEGNTSEWSEAKTLYFGNVSGIETPTASAVRGDDAAVYDLQGRRTIKPRRSGLYIVGGQLMRF